MALSDIKKDEPIIKYGFSIGKAKSDIKKGEHAHCHNIYSDMKKIASYSYIPEFKELPKTAARKFMGYKRKNGKTGIRNEIWIIPIVTLMDVHSWAEISLTLKNSFADLLIILMPQVF